MRRNVPLSLSLYRGWPLSRQAPGCCRHSRSISMSQAVALPDSTESLLAESGHIAFRLRVVDLRQKPGYDQAVVMDW